ncbi:MAG: NAD(+)/NADH kinase [Myxococcota bacterium]
MPTQREIRRVLVVYKTSPYARYVETGELALAGGADGDRARVIDRLRRAHEANLRTIETVRAVLARQGIDTHEPERPTKRDAARADLMIAVGGDGTFLRSSRCVARTPMLGVNSAPNSSVGHYCATDGPGFEAALERIRAGEEPLVELTRIAAWIGRRRVPHDALNDVLFAHRVPAASTRCVLRDGRDAEFQTSSGVWVSTASGSTGAIRSAGGVHMEPLDRRLQYRSREPFLRPDQTLRMPGDVVDGPLELVARSPHLGVWIDGHGPCHRVHLGERVVLARSDRPLRVYGYHPAWS